MAASRRLPADRVFLAIEAVDGFAYLLMGTIFSVYLIVEVGLDPFRLLILGTILEAAVLLFEVPTGVVADTISRRTSVIVGMFLTGLGFSATGLLREFWQIAAAQVSYGIGYTFISGALVAWITDEVGETEAARLYVSGSQLSQVGALLGIAVSVGLATIALSLPLVVSGVVLLALAAALVVVMPEDNFPQRGGEERATLIRTFKRGVAMTRRHPILGLILGILVVQGMSTEGFDRLAHLHLIADTGLPALGGLDRVLWFGILDGGGLLLAIGGAQLIKRRVDLTSSRGTAIALAVIDILLVIGVVAFGLVVNFYVALVLFWIVALLREMNEPLFDAWINQGLDPASRATVNSMGSQAHAFGEMAGGPGMGLVARASVPGAIVVSGVLRAPALILFWRALRKGLPGTIPARTAVQPDPPPPHKTVVVNQPDRP